MAGLHWYSFCTAVVIRECQPFPSVTSCIVTAGSLGWFNTPVDDKCNDEVSLILKTEAGSFCPHRPIRTRDSERKDK